MLRDEMARLPRLQLELLALNKPIANMKTALKASSKASSAE
jgi:hypothetical protein